jgi:rubrerythrin
MAARSPELRGVEVVSGITRSDFILRGALATGAIYGAGAVGPYVGRAFGATASGDIDILNFALTLENLEAAFYKAAVGLSVGLQGQVKDIATEFGAHEAAHAKTLSQLVQQLGGKPGPAPQTRFPGLKDTASFLKLAVTLEEVGIAAYNGAAPSITSPDLLAAAGGIAQVEARHAGALRMLAGQDPAPDAFDKPATPDQVAAAVKPFVQ